uniref:Aryl sulfotransferase n=1 Tax=Candidatus Kentrum sp. UNK TaxID=2126344 RepID=A0A451B0P1_9GAMM|nr:MAG: aryl sulfotransferase [Candidatus Kentron sp. UNK]VFK71844.1 MAG: aryl sulfotransferase [Candidatus Kentron sp. UNK]
MNDTKFPAVTRIYQNHHLDSTRWERFEPRAGDVITATSVKSGTTWVQWIVLNLLFPEGPPASIGEISPWLEMTAQPLDATLDALEKTAHRRVIKTHLPLDGLRYFPEARYIIIGRDGRDVAMSLWAFYRDFSDEMYEMLYHSSKVELPRCPEKFEEFWANWITRGWFEWERDGYPFWSHLHFMQTWWEFRHSDNILFVHFNDMLKNLEGAVRRIAAHLSIDLSPERARHVAGISTFDSMKRNVEKTNAIPSKVLKGGPAGFFHKGTNGRWREVLSERDLEMYRQAVARVLSPDCAKWLENGGEIAVG